MNLFFLTLTSAFWYILNFWDIMPYINSRIHDLLTDSSIKISLPKFLTFSFLFIEYFLQISFQLPFIFITRKNSFLKLVYWIIMLKWNIHSFKEPFVSWFFCNDVTTMLSINALLQWLLVTPIFARLQEEYKQW